MEEYKIICRDQREEQCRKGDEDRYKLDHKIKGAYKMILKEYNLRYKNKKDYDGLLSSYRQTEEVDRREKLLNMREKLERSQ